MSISAGVCSPWVSLFLLNFLYQQLAINAFRTNICHSHALPGTHGPSVTLRTTTLIHRSSSTVALQASSDEEETIPSPSSFPENSEIEKDAVFNQRIDDNFTNSQSDENRQLSTNPPEQRSPSAQDLMLAMGTNPRRIVLSLVSATGIALAGNLFGVTSRLLTTIPEEQVEATGLDTYFPRGDYKRCQTQDYTFVIPKEWVADTYVELAKAQRKVQPLDYSMQERKSNGSAKLSTLPDSAYGPPGRLNQKGQPGDTNVSVIVNSGLSGFTLRGTLGTPMDAAETLLSKSIAPEGSGKVATLIRSVEGRGGELYKFEYILDRGTRGPPLRNIAVIAASEKGDKFVTLTVVAPAKKWEDANNDTKLRKIADSFHLR